MKTIHQGAEENGSFWYFVTACSIGSIGLFFGLAYYMIATSYQDLITNYSAISLITLSDSTIYDPYDAGAQVLKEFQDILKVYDSTWFNSINKEGSFSVHSLPVKESEGSLPIPIEKVKFIISTVTEPKTFFEEIASNKNLDLFITSVVT